MNGPVAMLGICRGAICFGEGRYTHQRLPDKTHQGEHNFNSDRLLRRGIVFLRTMGFGRGAVYDLWTEFRMDGGRVLWMTQDHPKCGLES